MARKAKRPGSRSRAGLRLLLRVAAASFILFCVINIILVQNNIAEKRRELAALEDSIESLNAENEELADLIESDDISRYMEKLAVENNGYAYPDERRYYDTSHN